ncbi:hypothetical protein PHYSODRAFT_520525 [Phytophthora sojae]|uniref:MULE transposase domain-containing protein n=1 Tax=Phytophthora sojae (strain P6497) TaxID=1094619 RepID=G5A0R4_PHYSP|nr:hypothetical protein PHYSODRAFT_520525 [Phytophthora sojae]EGZ11400.1 hypothetical protein PHYSODRAFT_520525 [Phytophthora sojae]|eukprot:XP_009534145.1 hypothetical protein PHYSODRAFT_520525 [Phytophthora sojae]
MAPVRFVSADDKRDFLQFNVGYSNDDKYCRIMGFGHPDLIRLLLYEGVSLFVDATFKITPSPFEQTYILRWVQIQCKMKCTPKTVVCDFEQALHVAVKDQFSDSYLIGCLFHWKQAIRRKLIVLRIPADDIKKVMAPGCLDVLTMVPEKQLRNAP